MVRASPLPHLALIFAAAALAVPAPRAQSLPTSVPLKTKLLVPGEDVGPNQWDDEYLKAVAWLGDLGGDGWGEIATRDGGNFGGGSPYLRVLHLGPDGSILSWQVTNVALGGAAPEIVPGHFAGPSVVSVGDVDGDGNLDVAVGSPTGLSHPRVVFLDGAGGALSQQSTGLGGIVAPGTDWVGASMGAAGDVDGDGVPDLLLGAPGDDEAGTDRGALYVLYLAADGTAHSHTKITQGLAGFAGALSDGDAFGSAVATIGDLDGNGVVDVAVGAVGTDGGGNNRGAVWVLFMGPGATVIGQVRIASGEGGFTGTLNNGDFLGASLALLPDLDGDGDPELAAGAPGVNGSQPLQADVGAVWLLDLSPDGSVTSSSRLGAGTLGFGNGLDPGDRFGTSIAPLSSPAGGPCGGMLVSAPGGDDLGQDTGNLWVMFLRAGEWSDLGGGLAGQFGVPTLGASGVACAGTPVALDLATGQAASVATVWFIGFQAASLPFKGGTLVPDPQVLVVAPTTSSGQLSLGATWPAGVPSGLATIVQVWVHDQGAPAGLSATVARALTAP